MKRDESLDLLAALVASALGCACVAIAAATQREPFTFFAGLEGLVTTIALASALLLLQGLPPRHALLTLAPILGIEAALLVIRRTPMFAPIGVELIVAGLFAIFAFAFRRAGPSDLSRARDR